MLAASLSHWSWFPVHVFVWGLIGVAIYWIVKGNPFTASSVRAEAILDERFARGELSIEDYQERRQRLASR